MSYYDMDFHLDGEGVSKDLYCALFFEEAARHAPEDTLEDVRFSVTYKLINRPGWIDADVAPCIVPLSASAITLLSIAEERWKMQSCS